MTNEFASLPSDCETSAFATVACEEVYFDAAPVAGPRVNVSKLVLHNLTQPFARRISRTHLEAKVAFARTRGNIMALWATIHAECEGERAAIRAREDALANM